MMTLYDTEKHFAVLTNQINKLQTHALSGGQQMSDNIIISKALMLLTKTVIFYQIYMNGHESIKMRKHGKYLNYTSERLF